MILKSFFLAALIFLAGCNAKENRAEIFQTDGQAVRGFDAVAFHTDGKPVKGKEAYAYKWKDATWLFSSQSHLDRFKENRKGMPRNMAAIAPTALPRDIKLLPKQIRGQ